MAVSSCWARQTCGVAAVPSPLGVHSGLRGWAASCMCAHLACTHMCEHPRPLSLKGPWEATGDHVAVHHSVGSTAGFHKWRVLVFFR